MSSTLLAEGIVNATLDVGVRKLLQCSRTQYQMILLNSVSFETDQTSLCTNLRPRNSTGAISSDQLSQRPRLPLVIDYYPGLPVISGILRKYHSLLLRSDRLRLALPEVPIVTFRRRPNLRNALVLAKLDSVKRVIPVVETCKYRIVNFVLWFFVTTWLLVVQPT